ncbi:hypothetical protein [Pseudoalteromonas sp.]|uniref:hypothetical protein n=1 Tax=Pseudoalteromonas sp. TaxID=53249 RepID=UPI003568FE67
MKSAKPLRHFLNRNILLPFTLFSILLAATATTLYWFALDHTSEFYLFDDAQHFAENGQKVQSHSRFVSDNLDDIPVSIRKQFSEVTKHNHVYLITTEYHDNYLLAYRDTINSPTIYAAHQFDKNATLDIRPILLLICLLGMLSFALWLSTILHELDSQMALFVKHINAGDCHSPLRFSELETAKQLTLEAISNEHQAVSREKSFSSFLSHEIRHPLTLLGHQLAQFDHIDSLTEQVLNHIDELKKTQQKTVKLANTILSLWVNDNETHIVEIDVVKELEKWRNTTNSSLSLSIDPSPFLILLSDREFELLISQIETNFQKYGEGVLSISISEQSIIFTNRINPKPNSEGNFGIGTFIIDALACKAGLTFQQRSSETHYSLLLMKN